MMNFSYGFGTKNRLCKRVVIMKKPSAKSVAANKRVVHAQKVKDAERRAYERAYKSAAIQAAKAAGRAAALKDAAKKGNKRK